MALVILEKRLNLNTAATHRQSHSIVGVDHLEAVGHAMNVREPGEAIAHARQAVAQRIELAVDDVVETPGVHQLATRLATDERCWVAALAE